ncbi:MAG TPA: ABC transporter substrate-binding protein [Terriglobales bacterium]|nr:ABC transporter substrate-binding protein [Terriglobales bacterium]
MRRTAFQWLVISSVIAASVLATNARTRPRYGGTLRIESSGNLWDPNGAAWKLTTETLTHVDESGAVQAWLAVKWESQNRNKRWLFTVRAGVKFHDGTTLTAASVAEILNRCGGCSWHSVQAAGDAVVFDFDAPEPLLPAELAATHYGIAKSGVDSAPVGTGPMRVDRATAQSATLVTFEKYWNGRGLVGSVEVTSARTHREQSLDLGVGRTDVAEVPAEQIKRAQQDHLRVLVSRNDELIVLVMNKGSASIQKADVREAIAESIDRASLLNFIFQRQGETTGSLLPNWMTGYGPLFSTAQDLERAREYRNQAGPVPALTLTYDAADPSMQLVGERIALGARDAGITIRTTPAPAHWDLTLIRVRVSSFQPSVALENLVSELGGERKTPDDITIENLYQREHELLDGGFLVPLLYVPHAFAASDRVRNWKLDESSPDYLDLWTEVRK